MKKFLAFIYLLLPLAGWAFSTEGYAKKSVLASGNWLKISVEKTAMHCIPQATLKDWGFSDPAQVKVYGYGGAMLPELLSANNYIDDLPEVPTLLTDKGLVFFAQGPRQINSDATHSVNSYSKVGYYFLTEGTPKRIQKDGTALESSAGAQTTGRWASFVNVEEVSLGNSGRMMVGDDFRYQSTRTYTLQLPNLLANSVVDLTLSVVADASSRTTVKVSANGRQLDYTAKDFIELNTDHEVWARQLLMKKQFTATSSEATIGVTMGVNSSTRAAYMDYLELAYTQKFQGSQLLWAEGPNVATAARGVHVWDVTDPRNHYELNVGLTGAWRNCRPGQRLYAVWSESDQMPAPNQVGTVYNQNLHAMTAAPDMVIITQPLYQKAAEAIAKTHRTYPLDSLKVEVVLLDNILNEFGSGAFDPGAIRRFLKMLYDRGGLRFALMMGKGTNDNRALTSVGQALKAPMPLWVSENSLGESSSFSSDDFFAYLDDDSGNRPGRDRLSIAVGRIPATSAEDANIVAEKINRYLFNSPQGSWRSRVTMLADDENNGDHMYQSEELISKATAGTSGSRLVVNKIYCDAYDRQNSTYPQARTDLFRDFNDGIVLFTYIGHGSPRALGSKGIIKATDFRDNFYLRRLPFFYAATCSFLKWDMDITSQAEKLLFQRDGGFIGCISALRPVYISANGDLSRAFGQELANYDADGSLPAMGEIYRRAKNRLTNDTNKLRFVYLGDPALRILLPENQMTLDAINGIEVSEAEPYTVMARQELTLSGRVTDSSGNLLSDFNGNVTATLYDAEHSTTSHGWGAGKEVTFEENGALLFVATGKATGGQYQLKVRMPQNIADNYRPAALQLFANSATDHRTAAGLSRNVYAFGYDETTPDDEQPPVIHFAHLNDENFSSGDEVNSSPLLVARLSDNTGLNMSAAGVGQKMTLTVDGRTTYSDLSGYFVHDPLPQAGAMSGVLYYPVPAMTDGDHTLLLRVWDVDGNFADATLECTARSDLSPEIYEVFATYSAEADEVRFFVRHNRPDQIVSVQVGVYDLLGRPVWSGTVEGRSDMDTSSPLVWDLKNDAGQRAPRGIYVYRADLIDGQAPPAAKSKKLAIH